MGVDTNSVTLGTSIYALDGYNGTELDGGDPSCDNCYIDLPEPPPWLGNENNLLGHRIGIQGVQRHQRGDSAHFRF